MVGPAGTGSKDMAHRLAIQNLQNTIDRIGHSADRVEKWATTHE